MTLEPNREYVAPDEAEIFEQMRRQTIDHMKPIAGCLRRGQHAKATGCVTAEFQIRDDVPAHLRHGVFRDPGRSFQAVVRFSNSQGTFEPDSTGTARGLAIKLLEVAGPRAVAGDESRNQDFLMVDHPVFPFPNPQAYLEAISRKNIPFVGDLVLLAHLALMERDELEIIQKIRGKHVTSPLEITYWSGSPYWLGPATGVGGHAVKYSAVPHSSQSPPPADPGHGRPDYLTRALASHLQDKEACFDFKVQEQKNPVEMPVEDVSVPWDEETSTPIPVATLRIAAQKVEPDGDLAVQCESMGFNPWNALAEHRPMGGMNRLRRGVYQISLAHRTG